VLWGLDESRGFHTALDCRGVFASVCERPANPIPPAWEFGISILQTTHGYMKPKRRVTMGPESLVTRLGRGDAAERSWAGIAPSTEGVSARRRKSLHRPAVRFATQPGADGVRLTGRHREGDCSVPGRPVEADLRPGAVRGPSLPVRDTGPAMEGCKLANRPDVGQKPEDRTSSGWRIAGGTGLLRAAAVSA